MNKTGTFANVSHVQLLTTVRRIRRLPYAGEVVMPIGQEVSAASVIARASVLSNFQIIQASDILEVKPEELGNYLLVKEGELLQKGTPLMEKPALFGRNRLFRSPSSGYLHQIRDGCLVIERTGEMIELRAMVSGRVVSIIPERGVIIETHGSFIQTHWDNGKDGFGKLMFGANSPQGILEAETIGRSYHGAVIVAGSVERPKVFENLQESGARGLVVGSLSSLLADAARQASFPVMATEGIGRRPMAQPVFNLLQQSQGRQTSILAAEKGIRPQRGEIIIPLPTASYPGPPTAELEMISLGSTVRILQTGHSSPVGKVVRLHDRPRKTPLGQLVLGADVELDDGNRMFVPVHNMDKLF